MVQQGVAKSRIGVLKWDLVSLMEVGSFSGSLHEVGSYFYMGLIVRGSSAV